MSVLLKDQWVYVFGPFTLDPARRVLSRGDTPLSLSTKAFDLLLYLVENPDRVVGKDELFAAIWPGRIVEESNLSQTVFTLRKALGPGVSAESIIATSPGRGYRLDVPVRTMPRDTSVAQAPPLSALGQLDAANAESFPADSQPDQAPAARKRLARRTLLVAVCVTVALGAVLVRTMWSVPAAGVAPRTVVLADFDNRTGDAEFDSVLGRVLEIDLNQSPFVGILAQRKVQETLQQMQRDKDTRLTPAVAQEICERNQAFAVVDGAVAQIGNRYIVTLAAGDCATGTGIAESKADVSSKEAVVESLDDLTARIRAGIGESSASIRNFGVPIAQATTPSFAALKAYSLGLQARTRGDSPGALAFMKQAIEIDSAFAMAYLELGTISRTMHETQSGSVYLKQAFDLRDRVGEHEKVRIAATYQMTLGNAHALIQNYKHWSQLYPQDWQPWANLTNLYTDLGQYPEAIAAGKQALKLMPDHGGVYFVLASAYGQLNDFANAKTICAQAEAKGLDGYDLHKLRYEIAFIEDDAATMRAMSEKEAGTSSEHAMLNQIASASATQGKVGEAARILERAIEQARQSGADASSEIGNYYVNEIDMLVNSGLIDQARRVAADTTVNLENNEFVPGVIARTGDTERAGKLVEELVKRNPSDSVVNEDDVPVARAAIAVQEGRPQDAIAELQPALAYEWRNLELPSVLARAYLDSNMPERAADEYRKILAHRGVDGLSILYPLAYLGLARAEAKLGDKTQSRAAFEHFFAFWKEADPNLPVLLQARREYSNL